MYTYGKASKAKLKTCHSAWLSIAEEALSLSPYDITIVHGWRGKDVQNALYDSGASTKRFPDSRHNKSDDPKEENQNETSDAIDFAPYINGKIPWGDTHIFALIAGCFISAAKLYGYTLRYGGDWDSDGMTTDQSFLDFGHLEIVWEN